ncbi:PTS system mannose/fructose/sorbose family transporter subunit IID [Pseudoflavonifractor phocaeensis]|uniref:PTS system mannose/fructose/sorbose family transporter subunit IID n=1 Tax=Pseudoflavonifractor phocaeensis TaxID=1870988 RepID=UPI001F26BD2E|nr:PTS system mannose/fructose/sorbose family transporter subunit IID [Pseudoflavonifractor phocaeensis]MCF2661806.1 PTS system mannose/fructose/sorbose family transporter subunit IID [Pseudoflavonifractor phocaeensis]
MKKLSRKALNRSFRNWFYGHLTCFSQEHMQTFGYMLAMLPIVEELYDTNEEQTEKVLTYSTFFNTEPQVGSVVVGITAGMEEARANGEEVDDETINGIRAGLMGPLAGMGDSLVVGTLLPILLGIALGLSGGGSVLGPIFFILVWNIGMFFIMRFLYFKGYELGGKAVEYLVGEKANAIREAIIMLGTMVIGGVTAMWINITTSFQMLNSEGGVIVDLQSTLDSVYPKILSPVFVILCWYLLSKKRLSPVVVMLILVAVAFVGVLLGFFDPQLSY